MGLTLGTGNNTINMINERSSVLRPPRLLVAMEVVVYRYALILMARLPSRVAYFLGRMAGDLQYQVESSKRTMTLECIGLALGEELSPKQRIRVVHDCFRLAACKEIDTLRLAGKGQRLSKLVEIRGLNHVKDALAHGKGVVIGSAHFGSWEAEVGVLGAIGFPVNRITYKLSHQRPPQQTSSLRAIRLIRSPTHIYLRRHLRPSIIVDGGRRLTVAVKAERILQQNGIIFTMMDVMSFPPRHPKAAPIPFLNGLAHLPMGAATIAKHAGAPLIICLIHRSRDWRHQVIEISAPVPTEGHADEINRSCMSLIEKAIRDEPGQWRPWSYKTMAKIGLLSVKDMKRLVKAEGSQYWEDRF